jgi:hypothetical protein
MWMYAYIPDGSARTLPPGRRIATPTGLCFFPKDFGAPPPERWLRRA